MSTRPVFSTASPIINSMTQEDQEDEVDLDAILNETLGEVDLSEGESKTTRSAPSISIREEFEVDNIDETLSKALSELYRIEEERKTANEPPIPLPDTSHIKLEGKLMEHQMEHQKQLMIQMVVEPVFEMVESYKQNPAEFHSQLSAQIEQVLQIKGLFQENDVPKEIVIDVPSSTEAEFRKLRLFLEKMQEEDVMFFFQPQFQLKSTNISPTVVEEVKSSLMNKIEILIQQEKAQYLTLEEVEALKSPSVLSENEIMERKSMLTDIGFPEEMQSAIIQHKDFEIEFIMSALYALSQDADLLETLKKGISSLSGEVLKNLQTASIHELFGKIATQEQNMRFRELVHIYLLEHLK